MADAIVQDILCLVAIVSEGVESALTDRTIPTVHVIIEPEKLPVTDVQRVVAHIGKLESKVGDR